MKRKIELFMVLFLLIGAIIVSWKLSEMTTNVSNESTSTKKDEIILVVDPGHGGEDPGKVGINDVLEKDLNLQIAKKVTALLEKAEIKVVITREDDNVPTRKMDDLEQRVKLINDTKPTLCVCIHQNSYTDADIRGAQVFYYTPSEEGKAAATTVQESLLAVDTSNTRAIKANDTYYMLKNVESPIIIVECGFLSNPEEAEKLTQEEYQDEIAFAICEGIVKWLDNSDK